MIRVELPKISANVEEETLVRWLRREGERVRKGEPLLELTTDKAAVEMESPGDGTVRRILAEEKSVLPPGYVVALIGSPGEPVPDVSEDNARLLRSLRPPAAREPDGPAAAPPAEIRTGTPRATPAARRLARELGLDLGELARALGGDVVTGSQVKAWAAARKSGEEPPS